MSDSARTDHASEIDKVVSSVRKLVSSDQKLTTSLRGISLTVTSEADRLLLTPSLRVNDSNESDRHVDDAAADETSNVLVLHVGPRKDPSPVQATDAAEEAAIPVQPDDWEAGAAEDAAADAVPQSVDCQAGADSDTSDLAEEPDVDRAFGADFADADDETKGDVDDLVADIAAQIDPEALRALVAQLLREELQGDLGERMTRSVRKLVRREINRAIVNRELD